MVRQCLISASLLISTALQAEIPVQGVDPLKLEADWAGSEIVGGLMYSSANCRDDFYASGVQSEFNYSNESGITDDGRIATLRIGRWLYEP